MTVAFGPGALLAEQLDAQRTHEQPRTEDAAVGEIQDSLSYRSRAVRMAAPSMDSTVIDRHSLLYRRVNRYANKW